MSQKVKGAQAVVEQRADSEELIKDEIEDNYEDEGFEDIEERKSPGSGGIEDFYGTDFAKTETKQGAKPLTALNVQNFSQANMSH